MLNEKEKAFIKLGYVHPTLSREWMKKLFKKFTFNELSKAKIKYGCIVVPVIEKIDYKQYISYHKIPLGQEAKKQQKKV